MQATTGQFVGYKYYTSCSLRYSVLDSHPAYTECSLPDQAGFRLNHRCEDHLMVSRVLEQRCREWSVPLYISTIDFTKAFDSIKHSALWKSLRFYGVKPAYVRLLQRLYNHQEGTVLTYK